MKIKYNLYEVLSIPVSFTDPLGNKIYKNQKYYYVTNDNHVIETSATGYIFKGADEESFLNYQDAIAYVENSEKLDEEYKKSNEGLV